MALGTSTFTRATSTGGTQVLSQVNFISAASVDTLTNKTLTSPVITNPATTGTDSGAETLVNKTLTAPVVTNPSITGTDSGAETLVNKTLTAPVITNPSTTGTDSGVETLTNKTLAAPVQGVSPVADLVFPIITGTPVHLTGQTANLAATNLYAAPVTGLYMIHFQARTTTSGSGTTATVTLTWADEGGAKSFTSGSWALNSVAFAGTVSNNFPIHINSGTAVQISTSGTFGTSVYAIDAWLERVQ